MHIWVITVTERKAISRQKWISRDMSLIWEKSISDAQDFPGIAISCFRELAFQGRYPTSASCCWLFPPTPSIFFLAPTVIYFYLEMSASLSPHTLPQGSGLECAVAMMIDTATKLANTRGGLTYRAETSALMNDAAKSNGGRRRAGGWVKGLVRVRVRVISVSIGSCCPSTSLIYERTPPSRSPCQCADPAAGRCLIFPRLRAWM